MKKNAQNIIQIIMFEIIIILCIIANGYLNLQAGKKYPIHQ
jgi:hypothetical protein